MTDREKVINGLHCCAHTDGTNCIYCPYDNADEDCTALMSMDVLELLKEQETKLVEIDGQLGGIKYGRCPKCGKGLNEEVYPHWCGFCGQEVKWNENHTHGSGHILRSAR